MSIYTEISKKIGHKHPPVSFPTVEEATALLNRIEKGDKDAFEEIFIVWRFASYNGDQPSMDLVLQAFSTGCELFKTN